MINIELASIDDVSMIAEFLAEGFEDRGRLPNFFSNGLRNLAKNSSDLSLGFICRVDNRVVGFIGCSSNIVEWGEEQLICCSIFALYCRPGFQAVAFYLLKQVLKDNDVVLNWTATSAVEPILELLGFKRGANAKVGIAFLSSHDRIVNLGKVSRSVLTSGVYALATTNDKRFRWFDMCASSIGLYFPINQMKPPVLGCSLRRRLHYFVSDRVGDLSEEALLEICKHNRSEFELFRL